MFKNYEKIAIYKEIEYYNTNNPLFMLILDLFVIDEDFNLYSIPVYD